MVERPSAAFALLLVAGMLILFFGILVRGFVAVFTIQVETVSMMFLDALMCGIISERILKRKKHISLPKKC